MRDLGGALLDMYSSAQSLSSSDFGASAFEWLKGFVPFDSAAIGEVAYSSKGVQYRAFHLHKQPVEKILAYAQVAHLDRAADAMARNAGRITSSTISNVLAKTARDEPMLRYTREFGVEQCLNFCTSRGGQGEAMALWRGSRARPFEQAEAGVGESIAPHVLVGFKINSARFADAEQDARLGQATFVSRSDGAMSACDERARALLRVEWPGWDAPTVPRQLMQGLAASSGMRFVGRRLVAECRMSGSAMVVRLRPRAAAPELTPAQARVARALARGGPYKRIAAEMGISPATVRNHAHAIYRRLGARSRAELAWLSASGALDEAAAREPADQAP